ncbi:energy transducer TonB [uncultured Aquimarina sp.]|uniref:energy transducer TonB n=1 Tax=uncultured Aquimarina sp. TaxID=575652 RepID=UPI0026383A85|nr:energy transducer TonB [uncultured Aquimarina sp.]
MYNITDQFVKRSTKYLIIFLLIFSVNFLNSRPYQVKTDTTRRSFGDFVPFKEVDVPPVFAGCSTWGEDCEQRNCFGLSVMKLVRKHIKNGFDKENKYVSTPLRATIQFVIDTTGIVKQFYVSGNDEIMDRYAKEAIAKLSKVPRIRPGKHKGEAVAVFFELKIVAKSSENKNNRKLFYVQRDFGKDFKDMVFDNQVIHPECRETGKAKKDKRCLSEKIKKFVNKSFNVKIAEKLGLSGINTIYVRFSISKCGNVINVQSKGPHPELEKEAIRVVKMLPKMKPAKLDGEDVGVLYALPIKFAVK